MAKIDELEVTIRLQKREVRRSYSQSDYLGVGPRKRR